MRYDFDFLVRLKSGDLAYLPNRTNPLTFDDLCAALAGASIAVGGLERQGLTVLGVRITDHQLVQDAPPLPAASRVTPGGNTQEPSCPHPHVR